MIDDRTLATSILHVSVTAGANAATIASLITASLPTWASIGNVLSVTILGVNDTSGTTRPALLYGAATPLGYLPAGVEKDLPVRKGAVYLKRISGDVTVMLEVYLGPNT
jgi:hypothetical protein